MIGEKDMISRKRLVVLFAFLFLISFHVAWAEDRQGMAISEKEIIERLTRLEEGQKSLQSQINDVQGQINGVQSQIDGLRQLILGGFAVLFAGMFSLVGFVIWDRRSAISPVINKTREMKEQERLILRAMKEYALKEPKMCEVLKSLGLL
jgi:hypothetical protein